jgi:hypothetical protein
MMSVAGREEMTARTMELLLERAAFPEGVTPVLHYCAPAWRQPSAPIVPGWDLVRIDLEAQRVDQATISRRFKPNGRLTNPWLDFKTVLDSWTHGVPALFFEDDLSPCLNAARRMLEHDAPADCGLVSYFDLRNEWPRPGLFAAPADRDLWGAQALKIPGHVVGPLQELAAKGTELRSWDVWLGRAMRELGLTLYHHSPSLVQHVGLWSMFAPTSVRPQADNYPGDDFDALGPCADPIVRGAAVEPIARVCEMHGIVHEGGQTC